MTAAASMSSRRGAKDKARAEMSSSHWTSSRTISSGWASAAAENNAKVAMAKRSGTGSPYVVIAEQGPEQDR
jgi:hypothetical protein